MTIPLPYDKSRCSNDDCAVKRKCWRKNPQVINLYAAQMQFIPEDKSKGCDYFLTIPGAE